MRTAAASAVALDALASDRVTSLGILGSGVQARSHLRALRMVRPGLTDLRIWSRTKENADRLAHEVGARSVSIEEAAAADVVLTATSSTIPVLEGRWLAPNAVVLSVGATGATVRELDDETLLSSWVVADSRAAVERESGDVRMSGAKVHAEIGEILADRTLKPREGRILFKAVGLAIEDLVGARLVWESIEARKGRN
jgi:thiomorpholine-carboxylate dehydrogenase